MELKIVVDKETVEEALKNSMTTKNDNDYLIPVMLTVKETADEFKLAMHFIRKLALSGRIKATRAGRKILINKLSVIEYLNSCSLDTTYGDTEKSSEMLEKESI